MSGKPCPPDCKCGKHSRTKEHNYRIGLSVALTMEAKRAALYAPKNEISDRFYPR